MKAAWRYFGVSTVISLLAIIIVFLCTHQWNAVYLTVVLAILEASLSFDNAIVNAKVLKHMSPQWQKRFLWWGIIIAVVGMRLIFPIILVYAVTPQSLWQVIHAAIHQPQAYAQALHAGYPVMSAFGGAFLLLVFLHFVIQTHHLIYRWLPLLITLLIGVVFVGLLPSKGVVIAYVLGAVIYEGLHYLSARMMHQSLGATTFTLKAGLIGFLYLEVLDASFSFDGVIAAFAISTDILVIMVGLGIGALWVRAFTLYLVKQNTLTKLIYLEYGAYYAIGLLAVITLLKNFIPIAEWIPASLSLLFILVGLVVSIATS